MSTCNSKNFSGGYTPGPPLTGKGRGRKEGKRQGEGKKGEGKRREGKGREGKGSDDWPPQTKFLDPPLHQNVRLKIFKLCNLEYYQFLAVIVSIRNLKQTASPRSHYKPTLNHACIKVPLTSLQR
jgi:hypothetical protein